MRFAYSILGTPSEDTLVWKIVGVIVFFALIILVVWLIKKPQKADPQKAKNKMLDAIRKMKMDRFQLRDKIIEILKAENIPFIEDPDFVDSLSIYIGEREQLVSLKYMFANFTDDEVANRFKKFLVKNNYC